MKKIKTIIIFSSIMLCTSLLHGAFLQELVQAQESRGIRVTNPQEIEFENHITILSKQFAQLPPITNISQQNINQVSIALNTFFTLYFNPNYIRYSTKPILNDFFEQLKTWLDGLRQKNIIMPWPAANGQNLKNLLILALKEICLFGRYTKHKEEHLVTFKLRVQYILTAIMMDSYFGSWKNELITNNEEFSLGSFYSWEVQMLKSEFKDSVALTPLFNKLSATIDIQGEQKEAQRYEQERAREQQQLAQRRQQEADTLRSIIMNIEQQLSSADTANKEILYLNYIRALLDPAYLDLSAKERKSIDTFNDQFKKLHAIIGNKFVPILSQDGINTLKLLVAKSLETIASPLTGKTGGVSFKNHVESVLKTLMTINPNQTLTENQIRFQWIKPLYTDNHLLTNTAKKKLLDIFNNQHFQRWQASIRTLSFKVLNSAEPVAQTKMPITMPTPTPAVTTSAPAPVELERPLIRVPGPQAQEVSEEIFETLPMPKRTQPKKVEPQKPVLAKKAPRIQKVTPAQPVIFKEGETPTAFEIIPGRPTSAPLLQPARVTQYQQPTRLSQPQPQQVRTQSVNVEQVGRTLINQALVAPLATIEKTVVAIDPAQKFDVIKTTDDTLWTAVHSAASLGRADVLELLLKGLTPDERYAVVTMRDKDGQTALHLAAAAKSAPTKGFKPVNAVQELLRNLSQRQQIDFVTMKDNDGITAQDIAQGINKAIAINLKEIVQQKIK